MDRTKDLFYVGHDTNDNTKLYTWHVYMQEPDSTNMIVFDGLRKEIAISLKKRLDRAIKTYYDLDG